MNTGGMPRSSDSNSFPRRVTYHLSKTTHVLHACTYKQRGPRGGEGIVASLRRVRGSFCGSFCPSREEQPTSLGDSPLPRTRKPRTISAAPWYKYGWKNAGERATCPTGANCLPVQISRGNPA